MATARQQGAEPAPPRLPADLRPAAEDIDGLDGVFQLSIQGADFAGLDLSEAEVEQTRLGKVNLSGAHGSGVTMVDCVFEQCDLANAEFEGGGLRRVSVTDSRLTGLTLIDGMVRDVTFTGSKLDMANFRASTLLNVSFTDCDLTRADFYGADLRGVVFTGCVLRAAQLSGAKMAGAKLIGCDLSGLGGVVSLAGATVRTDDMLALTELFAAELGITLEVLER